MIRAAIALLQARFGMDPSLAYAYLSAATDFDITRIAVTNVDVSLTLGPITVSATGGNLFLAQIVPAGVAPTLSYQALNASLADASITGIPGITLTVDAIGVRLNNAGTVNVDSGTLSLQSGTHTGAFNVAAGATLQTTSIHTFQAGSSVARRSSRVRVTGRRASGWRCRRRGGAAAPACGRRA